MVCAVVAAVARSDDRDTDSTSLTESELAWIATHPVVRLAPTADYPPMEFIDETGAYRGITADYMALIEQRTGLRFTVVHLDADAMLRGEPDLMGTDVVPLSAPTPDRSQYWLFTEPYLEFPAAIIMRSKGDGSVTLAQLGGTRVAVVRGYAAEEYLAREAPELDLIPIPDTVTGLRMVSFGLVDAFVSDLPVATYFMEQEGITNLRVAGESGFVYRMGISSRRDWPELDSILRKGLAQIAPDERKDIYDNWVRLSPLPAASDDDMASSLVLAAIGTLLALGGFIVVWNVTLARRIEQRTAALHQELAARRTMEAALRETETRFRGAFENAHIGMALVGADGHFLLVNRVLCEMLGYTQDEILELRFADITHPDDRESSLEQARAVLSGASTETRFDKRYLRKDGSVVWILLSTTLQRDDSGAPQYFISQMLDITERREAELELRRTHEELSRVTESVSDCIWSATIEKGQVWYRYCSPVVTKITGRSPEFYVDGPEAWLETVHPADRTHVELILRRIIAGQIEHAAEEYRIVLPDGTTRWIRDSVMVTRLGRGHLRLDGVVTDVTERRRLEEHRRLMMDELDHRVKNTLATVLAIADQTRRASNSMDEFRQSFTGRILALSRVHEAIAANQWEGAKLRQVISLAIDAHAPLDGKRLRVSGDDVLLAARTCSSLCVALHELTTNAVKYGALSNEEGRLAVSWKIEGSELRIDWIESGVADVHQPTKIGTGTTVIRGVLEHELSGRVEFDFRPDGLACTLAIPDPSAMPQLEVLHRGNAILDAVEHPGALGEVGQVVHKPARSLLRSTDA